MDWHYSVDCQHLKLLLAWTGCASNKRASAPNASLRRDIHTHTTTRGTLMKSVWPAPMSGVTFNTTEVCLNYHLRHTFIQRAENRAIEKSQTGWQLGG